MQSENLPHIDKTQKSLAMLAIMRRIEEKRKKRSRRRTPAVRPEAFVAPLMPESEALSFEEAPSEAGPLGRP